MILIEDIACGDAARSDRVRLMMQLYEFCEAVCTSSAKQAELNEGGRRHDSPSHWLQRSCNGCRCIGTARR